MIFMTVFVLLAHQVSLGQSAAAPNGQYLDEENINQNKQLVLDDASASDLAFYEQQQQQQQQQQQMMDDEPMDEDFAGLMQVAQKRTVGTPAGMIYVSRRSCIRRGGSCDHRRNDCCFSSSCRCNLWGSNCRCHRAGLFQKWG